MKPLIALIALLTFTVIGADFTVIWVNDASNPVGTQTVISYGGQSGVYTNSVTVAYGVTNVVITNFPPGKTVYASARAFDGVSNYSVYCNEDSAKVKLNGPKNLTVTP